MGIFVDDKCVEESDISFFEYVVMYYTSYYGSSEQGEEVSALWNSTISTWNDSMNVYKICQPCRAYDLGKYAEKDQSSGEESKDDERRFLENDGEGDSEQWGYDCYDDAGYTNCNQVSVRDGGFD